MFSPSSRRRFLQTVGVGTAALGLADLPFVSRLPRVSADEARLNPQLVRLDDSIEPLVRLLEETPRDRLLEAVAERIHAGTSYQEVLAALMLAGVRNVQPRPSVGFKFHSVLVVNSAHLASLAGPDEERWLPIFWALDYFKSTQLEEERKTGWKLRPVDENRVPSATKARQAFVDAMQRWDVEAADAAVAGLARSAGSHEVVELFYRFGGRDYRSIGHKAIYVANSWRTLQCIGWQHAEPVLRSLAYALLNHEGEPNPADNDLSPDQPWRHNQELAKTIRPDWLEGKSDEAATRDLLTTLRTGSPSDAADQAAELLNRGIAPDSVWDAVFVGSGELLMRQPGIIGLHTLTTANAMRYAFGASADDETRRLLLLQNCAFVPKFRESAQSRGRISDTTINDLEPRTPDGKSAAEKLDEIFAEASGDRRLAAAKIRGYLAEGGDPHALIDTARRLVFRKGNDAHDYKFSSAVLEDYAHLSSPYRDLFLALSVFNLPGSRDRDNQLVERTRAALA
ncbi:MAG: twin-arginine translocation signal domain-containing protein [Planctomycetales bacterium]|nr:twin-arginine translocation signal domain-containing protein [Planctomycetales bacterium]